MRKLVILSFVILGFQLLNAQVKQVPADYGYLVKVGQQAPDFSAVTTDGKTIRLSDLKGKVVMLQFTASWCSVCRREMPHIEKEIWQKQKNNPSFALFGIDLNEPKETVEKYIKQIPISYPVLLDPGGEIFYSYAEKGAGVTRNVIIDQTGKIIFMTRLFKEEEFEEMNEVIERCLLR
jgi:peroxiredoxin